MEYLETEHGIFTNNVELGLSAKEVYEKWLFDRSHPKPTEKSIQERIEELNKQLAENNMSNLVIGLNLLDLKIKSDGYLGGN